MLSQAPQKASLEARMLLWLYHLSVLLRGARHGRKRIRLLVFCSTQKARAWGLLGGWACAAAHTSVLSGAGLLHAWVPVRSDTTV